MALLNEIQWHANIGDPSLMGWFTVGAYFCTAILASKLYLSSSRVFSEHVVQQKQFWLFMAVILFTLGINKQLDLQSLLTAVGRYYAHRDGWYEHRRVIQVGMIMGILLLMSVVTGWFLFYVKAILKANWLAVLGIGFLLVFVMVRATSFHDMDVLINTTILGMRMNWVLELSGIMCIAYSAFVSNKTSWSGPA